MAYILDLLNSIYLLSLLSLIGLKVFNSFIYLTVTYLIHRSQAELLLTVGHYLRLVGALADLLILLVLMFRYI